MFNVFDHFVANARSIGKLGFRPTYRGRGGETYESIITKFGVNNYVGNLTSYSNYGQGRARRETARRHKSE